MDRIRGGEREVEGEKERERETISLTDGGTDSQIDRWAEDENKPNERQNKRMTE